MVAVAVLVVIAIAGIVLASLRERNSVVVGATGASPTQQSAPPLTTAELAASAAQAEAGPNQLVFGAGSDRLLAAASAKLTQLAGAYQSEVWLSRNGRRVNAKSIMGVMMLAAAKGTTVTVETSGADEQEAIAAVLKLIGDKFGESD